MRFSEFVANKENIWLQDVIPLLQLIYVNSHNWSVDDSIQKVMDSKRKYVTSNLLVHNITNKIIKGELVYDFICDDEGNPCAVDPDTEEFATELRLDKSYVNIKSLINHVVNDIKDASLITDELLVIAGIDVPKKKNSPVADNDHRKKHPDLQAEHNTEADP